ncbi:MAG: MFS transporter [Acidobacteriota bacterium]|nr:MAG: MFS transporter [Acidobacteriota bacterium]
MRDPGHYQQRTVWSWALYDFANSPFTTLVVTFIYATYFTQAIASDPIRGTALWSRGVTVTALVVAFLSPVLGALADRGGYRKRMLALATSVAIAATIGLYFIEPGQAAAALIVFVIANIAFEIGGVFYNAFLPDIAPPDKIGRVSGYGWGLGYVGGLAALVLALVLLVQPETPVFGFSKTAGENVRATNLLVAVWFIVFSLPLFAFVSEDKSQVSRRGKIVRETIVQLRETITHVRRYRQIVRFLIARLVYNDGLVTIFAFGGIYAAETFGFTLQEVMIFGIVLNVAAGLGAFVFGYLDDVLGGKRTIVVTLIGLIVATLMAVVAPTKPWLWAAGVIIGIFVGPNQSASRSLMGRFVPAEAENEFVGFFAFSGKLTAFAGPLSLGILTEAFGSQRAGVSIVLVMFVVGLVLLAFVDEREGRDAAQRQAVTA